MKLEKDRSILLVIDVQERLAAVMHGRDAMVANTVVLIRAAAHLGVPLLASEQYPKGLGPTVPEVRDVLAAGSVVEKVSFSCVDEPGWVSRLEAGGRSQAVVCGIEAHVCVLQTALDLAGSGLEVAVVEDATTSRRPENKSAACARLAANGIEVVTTEMVVFEWLKLAGTAEFKEVSGLVR